MKKRVRLLLLVCMAIVMVSGCKKETKVSEMETLRIGMMSSQDVIPYVIMQEKGYAEDNGFALELETFTSAKDRDAAFTAGELDGVLTDYVGICMYQNADFDVKINGITDGDYILVAGKDTGITSIDEIAGKSIAISENTLIDYTLDQLLLANGMTSDDVTKEVVARIPDRLEMLRNGQIDLGLMPEPFATLALSEGAVYLGSANEIGLYPAVSAFSQTAIDEKNEAIRSLYTAYNQAVEYINSTDISEYEDLVIRSVGYPEEMKGQIQLKEFRNSVLPSEEDVNNAIAWASNRALCSADLSYEDVTYNSY